jgi:hypothetical protein
LQASQDEVRGARLALFELVFHTLESFLSELSLLLLTPILILLDALFAREEVVEELPVLLLALKPLED